MKNLQITRLSRAVLVVCGFALVFVLFTPIWRIELDAPQYPEGLELLIYADKLAGNVDIINGLNHYIGMKTLHTDDFAEFKILPGIIIFFAVCCLGAALVGRQIWLRGLFVLFTLFGILAMIDFWRWEYDYGHNLDPNAAIIVPGMAYQPPLIGFKQLLNFGAFSMPATGGWIFLGVGLALLSLVVYEWRRRPGGVHSEGRNISGKAGKAVMAVVLAVTTLLQTGCSTEPEPIRSGRDHCSGCRMSISDTRFAAEIITKKGKVLKFDDSHCVLEFLGEGEVKKDDIGAVYFVNFNEPETFIEAGKAVFLQSPDLRSPMNGNIAAFDSEAAFEDALHHYYGNRISWEDMQK